MDDALRRSRKVGLPRREGIAGFRGGGGHAEVGEDSPEGEGAEAESGAVQNLAAG